MTKYIRIDKREARRVYENGGTIVLSLNKPEVPMGEAVEFNGVTTCSKNGTGGQSFDTLAVDSLQWKHRYPGSQGLVWYTPAPAPLTPYDTGERLVPIPWVQEDNLRHGLKPHEDYGMVDFDNEESATVFKLHAEREGEGYVLKVEDLSGTPIRVEVDSMPPRPYTIAPTEALQEKVRDTIAELRTEYERGEAAVFWEWKQAVIIVPGEKGNRKQQIIMVHEEREPDSAIVKGWASGVRDTRIG